MRIGLLSVLHDWPKSADQRPPFARFAGSSVVERQLDLALAMGCESIACLVDAQGAEVVALQHRAERGGARFMPLRDPRPLSGMVSAADELLVIAPGILPDDGVVVRQLVRPAVLVFSTEPALGLGYERIDAESAWSGVLLTRGAAVERLAELPPDADTPSALLRIALQGGTIIQHVDKRLLDEGDWHLNPTAEDLADRETRWIRRHAALAPFTAPGLAVAERMGARLAQDILGKGTARLPWLGAALGGTTAVVLAVLAMPGLAVFFAALAALLAAMGATIERIGAAGQVAPTRSPAAKLSSWLMDPLLLGLLAASSPEDAGWLRLFVPAALLGLLRLGELFAQPRWRPSYADRIALAFLLAPPALLGYAQSASALAALLVLASLFFTLRKDD